MGKKKHQFINKKTSHKFNVVHRSQRDPLQPDEESSQHVLVPAGGMSDVAGASTCGDNQEDQQVKFGIYYDDDYDYLQHLKPRGEGMLIMAEDPLSRDTPQPRDENFGILNLPSEALPSKFEVDVGMLNKGVLPRGPQPDWDPDIVAALDDDVDFDDPDNFLEDNFINMANAEMNEGEENSHGLCQMTDDDIVHWKNGTGDMEENVGDIRQGISNNEDEWETDSNVSSTGNLGSDDINDFDHSDEETKSRFTNYSMTSSVIHRTEGLKLLDDHFERIMEEYDEEEIGPMDHEETTGTFNINSDLISQLVDDFIDQQKTVPLSEAVNEEAEISDCEEDIEENDDKLFEEFEKEKGEKWDCESIISMYSNIYNHPKLIDEPKIIKLHKKTGLPVGIFNESKNKEVENIDDNCELAESVILNNIRKKGETPEDKRNRKQEVKEQRKNRRMEKKENKIVFKDEHKKQELIARNKTNQMGKKI